MAVRAVLFDFYGTLARATQWRSADEVLAEHGYTLPAEARNRWFNEGIDGIEHLEQSRSREHYMAWQQERTLAMLAETDVHPDEYEIIVGKLREGATQRVLAAYSEVPGVLSRLRSRGLRLAICSNWDWDLAEAVDDAKLTDFFDVQVSSAWAGARKPHPRIFRRTLAELGVEAAECIFVGDSWGPDVEGPRAVGIPPVYLRREGHWEDPGAPSAPGEADVLAVLPDLEGVTGLV
ncbi:MAG: HAD family hydrolase [Actinobacteria bacterium]|nr:HAD family hydrolase [Actinomycetota bacterium]